jgi:hypothetical protein
MTDPLHDDDLTPEDRDAVAMLHLDGQLAYPPAEVTEPPNGATELERAQIAAMLTHYRDQDPAALHLLAHMAGDRAHAYLLELTRRYWDDDSYSGPEVKQARLQADVTNLLGRALIGHDGARDDEGTR